LLLRITASCAKIGAAEPAMSHPLPASGSTPPPLRRRRARRARGRSTRGALALALVLAACGGVVAEAPPDEESGATGGARTGGAPATGAQPASGTGGSGATASCETLCRDGAAVACPRSDPADCLSLCAQVANVPAACASAYQSYLTCLVATGPDAFSCAADGAAQIRASVCPADQSALLACVLDAS